MTRRLIVSAMFVLLVADVGHAQYPPLVQPFDELKELASISDVVGFALSEIQTSDGQPWTIDPAVLDTIMGQAARSVRR